MGDIKTEIEEEDEECGACSGLACATSSSPYGYSATSSRVWELKNATDPPEASMGHSLTVIGTSLYAFGGRTLHGYSNRVHRLHVYPELVWSVLATTGSAPAPRAEHAMVAVGVELYCIGGATDGQLLNDVYVLQATGVAGWRKLMPPDELFTPLEAAEELPRCCGHSVVELDEVLYVFGGKVGPTRFSGQLHTLDLKQSRLRWHNLQAFGTAPSPRAGHSAALMGTDLYICGGSADKDRGFVDLYVLDLAAPTMLWRRLKTFGDLPWTGLFDSSFVHLNAVYVAGVTAPHPLEKRLGELTTAMAEVYVLRLSLEPLTWQRLVCETPVPPARSGHAAALFDDQLFVLGGQLSAQSAPVEELWALKLDPQDLILDGKPVAWRNAQASTASTRFDIEEGERYGVVRARREKVPLDGVRFVVPVHGSTLQIVFEQHPVRNLRIIFDGIVQCETEDLHNVLRCTVGDDVTVECSHRRSWVRSGVVAMVNGVPVEGSYTDPLNILEAACFPAKGLVVLLLLRTFYNFFTLQHLHFSVVYFAACVALSLCIYHWTSHPKAGILLALAIGLADTAEASWWLVGHIRSESDWLLALQLLLLCARVGLLCWMSNALPLLSYI
eukprot:GGOE01062146.1.p1 GENE.GGOE01062146.1~~GGOE01062146.1.p1  ORF type:complete len:648 (-),score=169.02 GGOE01062146.1:253-2091(-)